MASVSVESVNSFLLELIEKQNHFTELEACKIKNFVNKKLGPKLIYTAVKLGNANLVQYLLAQGISPNCSVNGYNPLYEAVQSRRMDLVKILIVEGKANPNQQARGGVTPAIKLYKCPDVDLTTYILGISNLNIRDYFGNPLLYYLEVQRPRHLKKLRELTLSRTSVKTVGSVYTKINEKYLAHVWKIGGKSFSKEKAPPHKVTVTELEGFSEPYVHKKISESLVLYAHKASLDENCFESLIRAFKTANTLRNTAETRLEFYKKNNFLLLNGGYIGHYSLFYIFKNLFFHLNRAGDLPNGLDVFSFNPEKLDVNVISEIDLLTSMTETESQKTFSKINKLLGFSKGSFVKKLETHLKLPLQEVGNCVFDNSEGVVFLFLALKDFERTTRSCKIWFKEKKLKNLIVPIRGAYENWLAFHKELALKNYHLATQAPEYPNTPSKDLLKKISCKFQATSKFLGVKREREYKDSELINRLKKRVA